MLNLYNSLTRTKEAFTPIHPGKISIYACGITVYDVCHLGHARSMVCFDMIVRFLRFSGFDVTFVRNITDIDDKIITRAQALGIPIHELTAKYIRSMHEDEKALNIASPDEEPRATEYMDAILSLIQRLIDKGYAYISDNGDVCFEVGRFDNYGKLSNKNLDGLLAGSRVEIVKEKRSPLDFVLWKKAKPGEPSWPSAWGEGRPGWHIECSAMAMEKLGEHFDIHGGGLDLQFPHHENEIAQSECATDKPFANYWLHVGLLQVNNEKMAKSTGNFFTIEDVLKLYHPEVVRYFLLSSHYRSPLNYTEENLQNAKKALTRLYQSLKDSPISTEPSLPEWTALFTNAMNDDFNTPVALSVLFDVSHELNRTQTPQLAATLKRLANVLGLLQVEPKVFLQGESHAFLSKEEIEGFIEQRLQARALKNWQEADALRHRLLEAGIELEDGPEGTTWRQI